MSPRALAVFFAFVVALAVLTGWLIGTGGYRPPYEARVPDPATFRAQRWRDVRLVFTGGIDDHLMPRYRIQKAPVGGVARLVSVTRAAERSGPRLSLSIHASLEYTHSPPVPEDAAEEVARRRKAVLEHLLAGGTDLVVLGPDGQRQLMVASPRSWKGVGDAAVVTFGGDLSLGLAVVEAVERDADTLPRLHREGAQLTLLFERAGAPTNVDRRGFDLVVISGPDPTVAEETIHHVSFRRDAALGRVVDLRLPASQPVTELRPFRELDLLYQSHDGMARELQQAGGGDAKQRTVQALWDRLAPDLEALRDKAFLHQQALRILARLDPRDPGVVLERNHLAEDEARYGPMVTGRPEPHRTPGHPGNQACQSCHRDIYQAWSQTTHAHAWKTLEAVGAARSPACVTCHSTGFAPEGGDGWSRMDELAGHEAVGCTACHAPRPDAPVEDHPWGPAGGCGDCHTSYWAPFFVEEEARARVACDFLVERLRSARPAP
jgi:hypothetical protein